MWRGLSSVRDPIKWDAVLFDLDGTLADTTELIMQAFRHTMLAHFGEEGSDDEWLALLGMPLRVQMRKFGRSDEEADAMVQTYVSFQHTVHDEMVDTFPGVLDVVERLKSRGTRVAVVTSKANKIAHRTLACCGLGGVFETVVTVDDVAKGKPDPDPVHLAMARLGLDRPEGVVFLGDSPYDVMAGRAAGVFTAAALWGPFERAKLQEVDPHFFLESPAELLSLTP